MITSEAEYILRKIEKIFENDSSGHDYWHTLRVYKTAMKIAEQEVCDERIVAISALLHDVDDAKLFHNDDCFNARSIMLELNVEETAIEKVVSIISQVSFKGTDSIASGTIEGKQLVYRKQQDKWSRSSSMPGNRDKGEHLWGISLLKM